MDFSVKPDKGTRKRLPAFGSKPEDFLGLDSGPKVNIKYLPAKHYGIKYLGNILISSTKNEFFFRIISAHKNLWVLGVQKAMLHCPHVGLNDGSIV